MPILEISHLKKAYEQNVVLKDISFSVEKNDVVAIIGPSGSGKSTMLRTIIHLEEVDGGSIEIDGNYLVKDGVYPKYNEIKNITGKMGMVFQHFNLFPHLTVEQNLAIAPKLVKKLSKAEIDERIDSLLQKVGLIDKRHDYPNRLSGGQKQRVAIARALMLQPDILLFDEPTSALDPELTGEVLTVIRELASENMTMLVVTHEMEFAKQVANHLIFMDQGEIVEAGEPVKILENPEKERTKKFITGINRV